MAEHRFDIGVIVARKKLKSPWADHAWLPYAVLPAVPDTAPGTPLGTDGADELFYAGPCELTLHPSETAHYRDNLSAARPSLWVSLRSCGGDGCGIAAVTANPYEGEALTEGIDAIVEAVPMPKEIRAKVTAFFEAFHVERPFIKRERKRPDLEALGHRPRIPGASRAEGK